MEEGLSRLLAQTLPLALGATVSPVLFLLQLRALASATPLASGSAFVLGAAIPLAAVGVLVLAVGESIALPQSPIATAVLDLVLGVVLLGVGTRALRPPRRRVQPRIRRDHPRAIRSFAIGLGGMATNFTTLALYVPAMKLISESTVEGAAKAVVAVAVLVVALASVAIPVVLTAVEPASAGRVLAGLGRWLGRYERRSQIVFGFGFGSWLLLRGATGL